MNEDQKAALSAAFWALATGLVLGFLLLASCRPVEGAENVCDAVVWANADRQSLPEGMREHQAYLWLAGTREHEAQACVSALNMISDTEVPVRATPVANGRLLRVDLLSMAPGTSYPRFRALWDSLVVGEPYFYVRGQGDVKIEPVTICGQPFASLTQRTLGPQFDLIRDHADALSAGAPMAVILRSDWFLWRVLSTVDGGRYYDFLRIDKETKQADYLKSRGASEAQVAGLRSDERAALVRSGITGKPRRIDVLRGAGVRPSVGTGLVAITHDIFDRDQEQAGFDPLRNLLEAPDRGREIILERANGWHEFTLWSAAGELVDVAPDQIASDHRTPAPHTHRLYPAFSCIRCHGDDEGWKPFPNDVQALLAGGFDAVGDLAAADQNQIDVVRRLAGLYSGDLSLTFRLGRDSYANNVFAATRLTVPAMSAAIVASVESHEYGLIDAGVACQELGIESPDGHGAATLRAAIDPPSTDPIVMLLLGGLSVNRRQFEAVFTDLAVRTAAFVQRQRVNGGPDDAQAPNAPTGGESDPAGDSE